MFVNTPILPPVSLRIPYNWKIRYGYPEDHFILEQNAATAANLQQFSSEMKELKAAVAQHDAVLRQHEEDLQIHTEWKTEMSQALQDLAGQMKDGFRELAEAHQATEESLNILIQTVQDIPPRLPKQ
jgi:gas vesicle protein